VVSDQTQVDYYDIKNETSFFTSEGSVVTY